MERGWDPDVLKYLRKLINSISLGLLWLMAAVTGGLYYQLAYSGGIASIIFYLVMAAGLIWLIRYLYRTWSAEKKS